MKTFAKLAAGTLLFAGCTVLVGISPASARGGAAAYIMNSPGYQRALQESRQRYRDAYYAQQPSTKPHGVHPRKTSRHRGRR